MDKLVAFNLMYLDSTGGWLSAHTTLVVRVSHVSTVRSQEGYGRYAVIGINGREFTVDDKAERVAKLMEDI